MEDGGLQGYFNFLPLVQQSAPPGQAASVPRCGGGGNCRWVSANRRKITIKVYFKSIVMMRSALTTSAS